jgi:hypothetical protein
LCIACNNYKNKFGNKRKGKERNKGETDIGGVEVVAGNHGSLIYGK